MFLEPRGKTQQPALPRIIAHRGARLSEQGQPIDENTIQAFTAALVSGAELLETDLQVTSDGVAVIFHDQDLKRMTGLDKKVSQVSASEIAQLELEFGGQIPTLEQVLLALPDSKFNLDFKVADVVQPACQVIEKLNAQNRVLLASFSARNIESAASYLPNCVRSLGSLQVLKFYLAYRLKLLFWAKSLAKDAIALQIPIKFRFIRFDSAQFIQFAHEFSLEVHFWVVNEPSEMLRLSVLGADGIITDYPAVAAKTLRGKPTQ